VLIPRRAVPVLLKGLIFIGCIGWAALFFSCASGHVTPYPEDTPAVRDITLLTDRIAALAAANGFSLDTLGMVIYGAFRAPIQLITVEETDPPRTRVLICGGIHGNEPAGVETLLQFIEELAVDRSRYSGLSIQLIPCLNPWGWSRNLRHNREGRDINRDFAMFKTREARLVRDFLADKKYDLMFDHHEDPAATGFYLYQYGNPGVNVGRRVVAAVREIGFPIEQNVRMIILKTRDGLIRAPLWGLWYMRLTGQLSITNYFRLHHSRRVYTVETPTRRALEERLSMHRLARGMLLEEVIAEQRKNQD
jgi:hypothetical protein